MSGWSIPLGPIGFSSADRMEFLVSASLARHSERMVLAWPMGDESAWTNEQRDCFER